MSKKNRKMEFRDNDRKMEKIKKEEYVSTNYCKSNLYYLTFVKILIFPCTLSCITVALFLFREELIVKHQTILIPVVWQNIIEEQGIKTIFLRLNFKNPRIFFMKSANKIRFPINFLKSTKIFHEIRELFC